MDTKTIELNTMQMHTTGYALQCLINTLMTQRVEFDKDSEEYKKLNQRIGWCIKIKQKITK
jgi:hypothetical protein